MRAAVALSWVLLFAFSCRDTPPQPTSATIELAAIDASCTEAWLRLTLQNVSPPQTVVLRRDNQVVQTIQLKTADSTIVDTGLAPRRTYLYKAFRFGNNTPIDSSVAIQLTTLDTTSHNFTWQIDTLGDGAGSVLYDVAIINDTLAYAVGEVYKRDSLGNWEPLPYNLLKWDGHTWELKRVTVMFRGSPVTVPLEGIFARTATDIWLAGSIPIHGNGIIWVAYDIQTLVGSGATVSRMWGTPSEMYFVGRAGNIIRYSSSAWQRVESGTTIPIQDIWGVVDGTNTTEVLAIASNVLSFPQARKLLKLQGDAVSAVVDSGLPLNLSGVWFSVGKKYYLSGEGLFTVRRLGDLWRYDSTQPAIYKYGVRGNALNDVAVAGSYGLVSHFNGITWKHYAGNEIPWFNGNYYGLAIKGNLMVAIGTDGDRAVVIRGRRV